jgi:hypothetical protein
MFHRWHICRLWMLVCRRPLPGACVFGVKHIQTVLNWTSHEDIASSFQFNQTIHTSLRQVCPRGAGSVELHIKSIG